MRSDVAAEVRLESLTCREPATKLVAVEGEQSDVNRPQSTRAPLPGLRVDVDDARAAAVGIRKLVGKRLTLFTDLAPRPEIESLPAAFEQAFPQWCEYFSVDPAEYADWFMVGFLMQDKDRFQKLGLLPDYLPPFEHGFSTDRELWVCEQPSDYYRRHLVLHEGTHGFMNSILGGCGPTWYMEGMAELLATHRFENGRLELRTMPADRDETPMWGRIKIIQDAFAAGTAWSLARVVEYTADGRFETEPYAWDWGLASLLDRHPAYRQRFRQLREYVTDPQFNDRFKRLYADDWENLREEWQVFVADLEYGYEVPRNAVEFGPGDPLPAGGAKVTIAADRGWQSSRIKLEAGRTYQLRASGRYQVANQPRIWWCEPGGVSIRYYHRQPLGILLGAVHPDHRDSNGPTPLIRPVVVGLGAELTPERSGTLYLRINDSAAELGDNAGEALIEVVEKT